MAAPAAAPPPAAAKAANAPVISLANFEERKHEIAQQLFKAASEVGFFYITDHGIPQEEIDRAFATGINFLDREKEFKTQWPFNPDSYLGYRGPDELETVTGNRLWEWFSVGRYGTGGYNYHAQQFEGEEWPQELGAEFRQVALSFQERTHDIALKILRALWISLDRDEAELADPFDLDSPENPSFMAWNKYPALTPEQIEGLKNGKGKLPPRLHAHADMDVLTILFNRVGDVGLEIAPGKDSENLDEIIEDVGNIWNHVPVAKEWIPLDPRPGCITVNVGDGLTRWTDGVFKSTYHRVRAPTKGDPTGERYSIPYFVNPRLNYVMQGPEKRWGPITGFDILSKTGNAYAARRNSPDKSWQEAAYTDEIAELNAATAEGRADLLAKNGVTRKQRDSVVGNGNGVQASAVGAARAAPLPRAPHAPRTLRRSALAGAPLRMARAF
ncbi:hypothetical protein COHA_007322 [Chlorella ohadii]|uniref:Fe2OG dioxygenase domain-containing protein n=1 Tax=Chlorella ohadii TaxID=2649997 RepID=A0AAD5DL45_9CHLO|nr:hypothetical protein COHA_007322 [Chlorella ohadii]